MSQAPPSRRPKWPIILGLSLLLFLLAAGGAYYLRPISCSSAIAPLPPLRTATIGSPAQALGSLVGLQPFLEPQHYACAQTFQARLAAYLDTARRLGYLTPHSVVVFPEYIGTWLALEGEARKSFSAQTLSEAMWPFVLKSPFRFWQAYKAAAQQNLKDPAAAAIFQLKAPQMAQTYHRTFSRLAQDYGVTIVAGSIVLPDPYIEGDSLLIRPGGPLYNISVVYRPDGRPEPTLVRKAFPIATELDFTQPGRVQDLPTFSTPLGRLGVLICADSWFPESYTALGKIDLLAVPSYLMGDSCWGKPWRGYSGWPTPPDVTTLPPTEGEAWLTYAMAGRLPAHNPNAYGINVFLRGRFWELGADGRAITTHQNQKQTLDADILCVWIENP